MNSKQMFDAVLGRIELTTIQAAEYESSNVKLWNEVSNLKNDNDNLQKELQTVRAQLAFAESHAGASPTTITTYLDPVKMENLVSALRRNEKIAAIKLVRELCQLGLKEAKNVVEETYIRSLGFQNPGTF